MQLAFLGGSRGDGGINILLDLEESTNQYKTISRSKPYMAVDLQVDASLWSGCVTLREDCDGSEEEFCKGVGLGGWG